jgi:hypothetical protein
MWWYVCNVRYTLFMHNRTHKLRANETTPASPQNTSFDLEQLLDAPIECLHCGQRARAASYAILISAISTPRSKVQGPRSKVQGPREKGEGRREKGEGRREKGEGRREKGTLGDDVLV